jgi:hypothetical protein
MTTRRRLPKTPRWDAERARRVLWLAVALSSLACAGKNDGAIEDVTVARYPGGIGGAPAAPESTCDPLADRDSIAVYSASRQLAWSICRFEAPNVYARQRGERLVTEGEFDSFEQVLAEVKTGTPEGMCGADAGFLTLDVRTDASTALYISSSSCPPEVSAGRTPATGISDLWVLLDDLSQE